ncbi:MAG: DUF1294 domain-containing protein [Bacteroidales bacterium]|nr:DUF1294 domain-containing protein [Bacteroidales bacterium]
MNALLIVCLIGINIVTFIAYGVDKWKAQHDRWRIPEATLLLLAAIGGSIGAWAGMKTFHHKTLHAKFRFGVPALMVLQMGLLGYLGVLQ